MRFSLALIFLVALAACAQQYVCPDGSVVASSADCQAPEPAVVDIEPTVEEVQEVETPPPTTEKPVAQNLDSAIQSLFELHKSKVKSYKFLYSPIEKVGGSIRQTQSAVYSVREDNIKVENNRPTVVDPNTYVDTVYLNTATKTAKGFCNANNRGTCAVEGASKPAAYEDYIVKLPAQYIADVKNDAKIVGTINFENREVKRIRWTDGALYGEMYVDDFMGLPLRVAYYSDADYGNIVRGVEFLEIAYNQVKEDEVTI